MKFKLCALLVVAAFVIPGCTYMDKAYFFRDKGVVVASCPNRIEVTVNDAVCTTPCKLRLPDDTAFIEVGYNGNMTAVPVSQSGFHGYSLTGTLIILNADNIGQPSDMPDTAYFIRDTEIGLSDVCGAR